LIHYIGYYNEPGDIEEREPMKVFASTEKMNYIASILSKSNKVRIVSPGFSCSHGSFEEKKIEKKDFDVIYLKTHGDGKNNLSLKKIAVAAKEIRSYISYHVRSDDKIIFYSVPSMWLFLKDILTRYDWILELEELYYFDKPHINPIRWVYKSLENGAIAMSKKIIYVSETLKKKVGKDGVVIYGPFEDYEPNTAPVRSKTDVKIIYTGSIDETRGAFLLAKAFAQGSEMRMLPNGLNIEVSFIGYFHGRNAYKQKKEFMTILDSINRNGIKAVFKENLSGNELREEIIKADICVMPQKISSKFSEYSFPSKLPRYLSYGKLVVSSAIKPVVESSFGGLVISYYSDNTAELLKAITRAIELVRSGESCEYENKILNKIRKMVSEQEENLIRFLDN